MDMEWIIFMLLLAVIILIMVLCTEEIEKAKMKAASDALASALGELISGSDCDGDCKSCGFPNNRSCAEGNARKVLNDYKRKYGVEE